MRILFPVLALSLLLAGCSKPPSDAHIRRHIVGTWSPTSSHTVTIFPNGSLKVLHPDATLEGTWTVDDGFVTETITNITGSLPGVIVGQTARYEVLRINEFELRCRYPDRTGLLIARRQ